MTRGRPRACIIRQSEVYNPGLRSQAEALHQAGFDVDLICLRHPGLPRRETLDGVAITRLPGSHTRGGKARYVAEYVWFFALATSVVAARHLRRRYQVIQVNTMPDFLVFAGAIPKLVGCRVVAYMQEPSPELAETLFGPGLVSRALAWVEQRALRFADHAITVTDELKQRFVERGARPDRITVVLNCGDPSTLLDAGSGEAAGSPDTYTVICHGSIEDRYGQDTIIEAAHILREEMADLRVVITGSGSTHTMLDSIGKLGLQDVVSYEGWVSLGRLGELLRGADVGIVAQKASPYSHLVHTNKMVDYWIFGLPVIASRLQAVSTAYDETILEYFEAGDPQDLARAIRRLRTDPARRAELVQNGQLAQERHGWAVQREIYLSVFDHLLRIPSGAHAKKR